MNTPSRFPQAGAVCEPARPMSPVEESLDRVREEISELDAVLTELVHRLDPVMMPAPPSPSPDGGKVPEMLKCPLASAIDEQARRVRSMTAHVRRTLGELSI